VSSPAELWAAAYAALPYPSDRAPRELTRIAAKCLLRAVGWAGPIVFDGSTCEIASIFFEANDLPQLIRYHDRTQPTERTTPLIIVRLGDAQIVVEGNNRVNKWVLERDSTPRHALVITPRSGPPTS
jgi:hypothetical protein